ncbi:MAG: elongation factor Ts [Patescibacteria group bacterium]|nr:elongation factor Ts [bacterium]MDZ4240821.1 elongation factor Ts [Patescibacteria group bacterium]
MITTEQIKELRDITGVSVMECKKALEEAQGDKEKAIIILRKKSKAVADKKATRELKSGTVAAYIHNTGMVGVLVELACETDFVARNEEFKRLAYDIAMHVAALNPEYLKKEDIPEAAKAKATEVFSEEVSGKPKEIQEKILSGKLDAYFNERVLLAQAFIKNPEVTIQNLIEEAVQKFGEKTEVVRFTRFSID